MATGARKMPYNSLLLPTPGKNCTMFPVTSVAGVVHLNRSGPSPMRVEALRIFQVVVAFFLAAALHGAHAIEVPPAVTAHLRTIVGELPIRDAEDAMDISAYRDVTDPEPSYRYKFARVLPTETHIRASESLTLKITTKSPGELIAYIHGNPDPFWFHLKQGRNSRQGIQISSGLPLIHCGKQQFHVYIFQVSETQLLVWHRNIDGGYLACEIGP